MINKITSKSWRFAIYSFSFLIGTIVASISDIRKTNWILSAVLVSVLILFFIKKLEIKFIVLIVTSFGLGIYRYGLVFPVSETGRIEAFNNQNIQLIGTVNAEPDVRLDSVRYVLDASSVEARAGPGEIEGNILAVFDRYPRFNYGDVLKVTCTIKKPEPIVDEVNGKVFRYDLALARQDIFALCQKPILTKIGSGGANPVMSYILAFKNQLALRLEALWPEPYASFMAGLLYGYRGGLGPLNDLFSKTGVAHIVAVSGFNISVIATLLLSICYYCRINRRHAFYVVGLYIFVFVIFTGASASVMRAGIMGFIVLLAKQVGRVSRIGPVLLLTAVIMTVQNPLVLLYDAGFQLSFLATLGLVYLNPILETYLNWLPEKFGLRENTISTTAATIATLPLILFQFGRLALLTIFVNIAVLWVIPILMATGFAALLGSLIHIYVGQALAWIGWAGMWYVISVVSWFGGISWAAPAVSFSLPLLITSYLILLYLIFKKAYARPHL